MGISTFLLIDDVNELVKYNLPYIGMKFVLLQTVDINDAKDLEKKYM